MGKYVLTCLNINSPNSSMSPVLEFLCSLGASAEVEVTVFLKKKSQTTPEHFAMSCIFCPARPTRCQLQVWTQLRKTSTGPDSSHSKSRQSLFVLSPAMCLLHRIHRLLETSHLHLLQNCQIDSKDMTHSLSAHGRGPQGYTGQFQLLVVQHSLKSLERIFTGYQDIQFLACTLSYSESKHPYVWSRFG